MAEWRMIKVVCHFYPIFFHIHIYIYLSIGPDSLASFPGSRKRTLVWKYRGYVLDRVRAQSNRGLSFTEE